MWSLQLFAITGAGTPGRGGFVTWIGTMVPQRYGKDAPASADLGLSGGPVVVHEGLSNGGSSNALMVSPATHFKGSVQVGGMIATLFFQLVETTVTIIQLIAKSSRDRNLRFINFRVGTAA
jgi:hypothetical protein